MEKNLQIKTLVKYTKRCCITKKIKEELAGLPNIKKAMSVISEYCNSHACCDECPMLIYSPERCCYLRAKSPNNWLKLRGVGRNNTNA